LGKGEGVNVFLNFSVCVCIKCMGAQHSSHGEEHYGLHVCLCLEKLCVYPVMDLVSRYYFLAICYPTLANPSRTPSFKSFILNPALPAPLK